MTKGFTATVLATLVAITPAASQRPAESQTSAFKRMPDGKDWTTSNLAIVTPASYCYGDVEQNCQRYGRLYTWGSAQRACESLRDRWRLPTNAEWQQLAKAYGGVRGDSEDDGHGAFRALVSGGSAGFNVVFGGSRQGDGEYARLDGHGLYWTATESDAGHAWVYNFGQQRFINRHSGVEKTWALSVRCVRD